MKTLTVTGRLTVTIWSRLKLILIANDIVTFTAAVPADIAEETPPISAVL